MCMRAHAIKFEILFTFLFYVFLLIFTSMYIHSFFFLCSFLLQQQQQMFHCSFLLFLSVFPVHLSVMKYPQPVSTATVNEISDWLIKKLEELDIEDPGVYSRLLLSLLHTPFKLNAIDLLEIPQLKVILILIKLSLSLFLQKTTTKNPKCISCHHVIV